MAFAMQLACGILLLVRQTYTAGTPGEFKKCFQEAPLLYGCDTFRDRYEMICCTVPQPYAENYGFLEVVDFFGQLEARYGSEPNEIVFYDSQCGIPLYVAPRGRTYEAWKKESLNHGWPSFRETEVVHENVHVEDGYNGELVSKCNTHLGHNLPDAKGRRDCVNLMCMAGCPYLASSAGANGTGSPHTGGSPNTSHIDPSEYEPHGGSGGGLDNTNANDDTITPVLGSQTSSGMPCAGRSTYLYAICTFLLAAAIRV